MAQASGYVVRRGISRTRLAARKAGIIISSSRPQLIESEQEETDIM